MFKKIEFSNFVYSVGGAIVIMGALFKIQHWPGGGKMLTIGLIIEALIFLYAAFEKSDKFKEQEWEDTPFADTSLIVEAQQRYVNKMNKATSNIEHMNNFYESILKTINNKNR